MAERDREFEAFALARMPALLRSAYLLCGDRQQAEDLVQETLAKLYVRWHSLLGGRIDHPAAYAHTTLTRTFLSARRRRSSGETPLGELPEVAMPDATGVSDVRLAVRQALAGLAPRDRAVLVLRHLDDLSVEDTAVVLGITPWRRPQPLVPRRRAAAPPARLPAT